jgi:hypothetical protein
VYLGETAGDGRDILRRDTETPADHVAPPATTERAEAESERRRQDAAVVSALERARRARQELEAELRKEEEKTSKPDTTSLPVKHKTVR